MKQFEDCSVCTSKASSRRKLSFEAPASTSSQPQSQQQVTTKHQELKEPPPQKQQKVLSVSAEESEITTLPLVTLQIMWQKAEKLLNGENAITIAPGSDTKGRMVLSQSSASPHFVTTRDDGQYFCDNSCTQWVSSKICCSHTVAAAEVIF